MKLKAKKITLTLAILSGMALLPMGCDNDLLCTNSCGCDPISPVKDFVVKSFEIQDLQANGNEANPEIHYPYNEIVKSISLDEIDYLASEKKTSGAGIPGLAFACSIAPAKSASKLVDIQIINSEEVVLANGETVKVGEDISQLFGLNYLRNQGVESFTDFIGEGLVMYVDDSYKIQLLDDPEEELKLTFSIRIELENGEEFNFQNKVLRAR